MSTGSDRTVYGVSIGEGSSGNIFAVALLDTPVVQGASEVLDITYRVTYEESGLNTRESALLRKRLLSYYVGGDDVKESPITVTNMVMTDHLSQWGDIGTMRQYRIGSVAGSGTGYIGGNWSIENTTIPQYNCRSVSLGVSVGDNNDFYRDYVNGPSWLGVFANVPRVLPILTDDSRYPNWPVGPMYNHGVSSKVWYEELENLATGKGYPVARKVSGDYLSDLMACDHHVLRITKGGNVGTSRYYHSVYRVDGAVSTHFGVGKWLSIPERSPLSHDANKRVHPHLTQPDPFGPQPQNADNMRTKVYNSHTVMSFDYTDRLGFALHDLYTHQYHYFDEQTTPGLPIGMGELYVDQITRDNGGSIYMPVNNIGILKISNPFTAPAISTISRSTMGISSNVSAVGCTKNDRLLIHSEEGISYSDDDGVTWVNQGAWTYTGDTSISGININASSMGIVTSPIVENEIALTFEVSGRWYVTWYDILTNVVSAPTSYNAFNLYGNYSPVQCDPIRGIWMYNSIDVTYEYGYLKYGATEHMATYNQKSATTNMVFPSHTLVYDAFYNPVMVKGITTGNDYSTYTPSGEAIGSFTMDGKRHLSLSFGLRYDGFDGISLPESGINGFLTRNGTTDYFMSELEHLVPNASIVSKQQADISTDAPTFGLETLGLYREIGGYHEESRWDSVTATWRDKREWSVDAVATTDGSSQAVAKRVNFKHDTMRFDGRSYLDISSSLVGANLSTGLTILATYVAEDKIVNTLATDRADPLYTTGEGYAYTCLDLRFPLLDKGIVLLWRNLYGDLTLVDYTVPTAPVSTTLLVGVTAGEFRIGLTLSSNGSTASVFVDGVQIGNNVSLSSSIDLTSSATCTVGGRNTFYEINSPYYYDFFKGDITNLQVWGRPLLPAEFSTDNTNRPGLVTGSSLIVRYLLQDTIVETKTTSVIENTAPYGYIHSFPDGDLSSDSYIEGESYNAMVSRDSIVKGNVLVVGGNMMVIPHGEEIDLVTSPNTGLTIVPAVSSMVTEWLSWIDIDFTHGCKGSSSTHAQTGRTFNGEQTSTGDVAIEYTLSFPKHTQGVTVYLYDVVTNDNVVYASYNTSDTVTIRFLSSGSNFTVPTTPGVGDNHKLEYDRATSTASFHIDYGSGYTQQGSGVVTQMTANPIGVRVQYPTTSNSDFNTIGNYYDTHTGVHNMKVTYLCPPTVMRLGDRDTETGYYRLHAYLMASIFHDKVKIYADGVAREVVVLASGAESIMNTTTTVPGKVYLSSQFGMIIVDDTDIGKEITCDVFSIPISDSD